MTTELHSGIKAYGLKLRLITVPTLISVECYNFRRLPELPGEMRQLIQCHDPSIFEERGDNLYEWEKLRAAVSGLSGYTRERGQ